MLQAQLGSLESTTSFCCKGRHKNFGKQTDVFKKITGDEVRLGWKEESRQPEGCGQDPEQRWRSLGQLGSRAWGL